MKASARSLAVHILDRMDETGLFAETLLDDVLSSDVLTDVHDRRLLTEIVYGTLRMRGRIDWVIARFYRGDPSGMEVSVRNILRTALYQLFFTERIPAFAIVNEAVKLAKAVCPAASGLVNAVLRNVIRKRQEIVYPDIRQNPADHIAIVHSHPLWLVQRWIAWIGVEATLAFCRANNQVPPLTVRVNRLKGTREDVKQRLQRDGFTLEETGVSPDGLRLSHAGLSVRETLSHREGRLQVQDEASQLVARLLEPGRGENILDACAGVGVKTSHLAEMIQNQGAITAIDVSQTKLNLLLENARRLGITIITACAKDFRDESGEALTGKFDRVLLDVPCSGLGTLRRNPEIKWRIAPADLQHQADVQQSLLDRAAACLKPGGRLVYSTCSVMQEENEMVIGDLLARHPEFRCIRPPALIPPSMLTAEGFFRTRPDLHGADGFFGAVLQC